MLRHLAANLWLLVLTVVLCCVLYPLILWAVGHVLFRSQVEGSIVTDESGTPRGSPFIAQPFDDKGYFRPRPSAAGYNASASGASNWGANNPLLRDRVARTLGPMIKYREGTPLRRAKEKNNEEPRAALDVETWFKATPDVVAIWAKRYPSSAQGWVNADDKHKAAVTEWAELHSVAGEEWKKRHPDGSEPAPADLAKPFFESQAVEFQKAWPKLIDDVAWNVPAVFFDLWLQEHPVEAADLETVPADLVMASGSGLDPHITLKNAQYQLEDHIAKTWATRLKRDEKEVKKEIEALLEQRASAPLGGLVGVKMINVLEVNLELKNKKW